MSRRSLCALLGVLVLGIILWASREALLPAAARWLNVGARPCPADCVFVLGGDAGTRAVAAAVLVRRGFAPKVLIPKTADRREPGERVLPPEHELNRRVLVRCGVDESAVRYLGQNINSTYDEARALASFLKASPQSRALVVTNDYHTRRTRWIFDQVMGRDADRAVIIAAPIDTFSADDWWRSEQGFQFVFGEFLKLAIYKVCYGSLPLWLGVAIAAIVLLRLARRRAPFALDLATVTRLSSFLPDRRCVTVCVGRARGDRTTDHPLTSPESPPGETARATRLNDTTDLQRS